MRLNVTEIIELSVALLAFLALVICAVAVRDVLKMMIAAAGARAAETFSIWFRALIYFFIAFGTSMADKLGEILFHDSWPSLPRTVGAFIVGTVTGLVAVRAYNDSSAARLSNDIDQKRANGGSNGTQLFQQAYKLGQATGTQPPVAVPQAKLEPSPEPVKAPENPQPAPANPIVGALALVNQRVGRA